MTDLIPTDGRLPLLDAFINSLTDETRRAYGKDLTFFLDTVEKPITEVKEDDIVRYIKVLEQRDYRNSTINRRIYSISKLFGILFKEGIVPYDPFERVRLTTKVHRPVMRQAVLEITKDDVNKVITNARIQTALIVELLSRTGLRVSEALHLRKSDLTINNGIVKAYVHSKGGKERCVYFKTDIHNRILDTWNGSSEYLIHGTNGQPLNRNNVSKQVRRAFQNITGKDAHPHTLRHFYVTHQLSHGKDLKIISEAVGHHAVAFTAQVYHRPQAKPEDILFAE